MIETLVSKVFATRNAAHLAHWAAKGDGSFARHMALGDFYDAIIDKIDTIVEAHQGAFGLIGEVKPETVAKADIVEHIADEAQWIDDNRAKIAGGVRALENLIDDLTGSYLTTYYKLRNLS